ncbi:MAG: phage minor head protein [Elusimicrobiales bacterium]
MPEKIDAAYAIGLPPEKAIAYFRSKGYAITFRWSDMWKEAHAKAFTVAKCARLDVLQDIRAAVDKSLSEGQTFREFQKNLEPTLQAKGWWGKKWMADPLTGKQKLVQLGSPRRLETIYRTNIAVAESAGHWRELMESVDTRPYWQFIAVMDAKTRPSHAALNGKVFRWDDPFWKKFFPPLDWGCRCRVRALTARQVRERGLKPESSNDTITTSEKLLSKATGEVRDISTYTDPATGAKVSTGAGWDYNPGQAWQTDALAWEKARDMDDAARADFLADMATSKVHAEMFPDWVDGILQRGNPVGFAMTLGWLQPDLFKILAADKIIPASPIVIANDKGILHMTRPVKQETGSALTLEEIKKLPEFITNPEAVLLDETDGTLLFVRQEGKDKKLKLVVRVDYKLKGKETPVNYAVTSGRLAPADLKVARYKLLWGKI